MMVIMNFFLGCQSDKNSSTNNKNTPLEFVDPSQKGSYQIATRDEDMINRHDQELTLQVWFPSSQPDDDIHLYGDFFESDIADGGDIDCSQTYPVVLFSHGNGGVRYQSFFFGEYLASHGFIVLSPDHVGNTLMDDDSDRKPELITRRPQDISDAYDWLLEESRFEGCVDEEDGYAVVGHSFGGYTALSLSGAYLDTDATLEICATYGGWLCSHVATIAEEQGHGIYDNTDDRIWAAIPMTPAGVSTLYPTLPLIQVPTLVWAGSKDDLTTVDDVVRPIYDALETEQKYWANITEAGHYSFSNACDWINTYPDCGEDFLEPIEVHQIVNTVTTAFLQQNRGMEDMDDYIPISDDRIIWEE
jgi:predicted dienelactone hydrolase